MKIGYVIWSFTRFWSKTRNLSWRYTCYILYLFPQGIDDSYRGLVVSSLLVFTVITTTSDRFKTLLCLSYLHAICYWSHEYGTEAWNVTGQKEIVILGFSHIEDWLISNDIIKMFPSTVVDVKAWMNDYSSIPWNPELKKTKDIIVNCFKVLLPYFVSVRAYYTCYQKYSRAAQNIDKFVSPLCYSDVMLFYD